jgi:hypothetical protein
MTARRSCKTQLHSKLAKFVRLPELASRPIRHRHVRHILFTKNSCKARCVTSQGPPFQLAGRIPLYPTSGLGEWAQNKIEPLVRSTSEARSIEKNLEEAKR